MDNFDLTQKIAVYERVFAIFIRRGWKIDLARLHSGDLYVTGPRGNVYNLFGLGKFLRGDNGDGVFFKDEADIAEADGRKGSINEASALNLAKIACAYQGCFEKPPKLLTHTPVYDQKKVVG